MSNGSFLKTVKKRSKRREGAYGLFNKKNINNAEL